MRLLVFGRRGQLAQEIARLAPSAIFLGRDVADLEEPATVTEAIRRHRPDGIVNAAAYTDVDRAESEPGRAMRINAAAPDAMARAAALMDIPLVQVSTDYVFDGSGSSPRSPAAYAVPVNAYGLSKAEGEEAVRAAGGTHAILRTGWVFSPQGRNFVRTVLRLAETHRALRIVSDQVGGPTPASALAAATLEIVRQLREAPEKSGTYHFTGAPDVSWADFARAILAEAGLSVPVEDIPTAAYPTPARRPLNSRLDCRTTAEVFGISRPDWRAGLATTLDQLLVKEF